MSNSKTWSVQILNASVMQYIDASCERLATDLNALQNFDLQACVDHVNRHLQEIEKRFSMDDDTRATGLYWLLCQLIEHPIFAPLANQEMADRLKIHFSNHRSVIDAAFQREPRPTRIGRYQILEKIGSGAFGVVYRAYDQYRKINVALKTYTRDKSETLARAEAKHAHELRHPAIVPIYDIGYHSEVGHYLVMQLIAGRTMKRIYASSRPTPQKAVELLQQITNAIIHAHSKNIIHRDLKPSNILIDDYESAHVLDFGLAIHRFNLPEYADKPAGTIKYMAPEHFRSAMIDEKVDVWSLGVIFFELLAGFPPFAGEDRAELTRQILRQSPTFPPHVSNEMRNICRQALDKSPSRRPSARELGQRLELVAAGESVLRSVDDPSNSPAENGEQKTAAPESHTSRLEQAWRDTLKHERRQTKKVWQAFENQTDFVIKFAKILTERQTSPPRRRPATTRNTVVVDVNVIPIGVIWSQFADQRRPLGVATAVDKQQFLTSEKARTTVERTIKNGGTVRISCIGMSDRPLPVARTRPLPMPTPNTGILHVGADMPFQYVQLSTDCTQDSIQEFVIARHPLDVWPDDPINWPAELCFANKPFANTAESVLLDGAPAFCNHGRLAGIVNFGMDGTRAIVGTAEIGQLIHF